MKRAQEDDGGKAERPKRRAKTTAACVSCRRAKTRCEPPTEPSHGRCHRCTVLFAQCSFEEANTPSTSGSATSPGSRGDGPPARSPGLGGGSSSMLDYEMGLAPAPQIPTPSPFDATGLTPEDLVCMPSADANIAHWSTAPMTAMQELIHRRSRSPQGQLDLTPPAGDVLDRGQIEYLLDIFETHYTPWLNISHIYTIPTPTPLLSDFLTLARCAVTARHLPPDSFQVVLPRLQKLVEHAVLVHMFNGPKSASLEVAQALLILSLWSPAVGSLSPDVQDGALIAKAAVKMAVAIGLDQAMPQLAVMRSRAHSIGSMSEEDEREHGMLVYRSQLWSAICNVEWMLCLGTNRAPSSIPEKEMFEILNPRLFLGTATTEDIRTFRLRLTARLVEATQRGLSIKITDLKTFSSEMEAIFNVFARARNCILPLQVTFPHERMHMDVVLLMAYFHVLLAFFHGLTQVRIYMETVAPGKPWLIALDECNVSFIKRWGTMSVNAAQSVLITFFDIVDRCQASMSSAFPQPGAQGPLGSNPGSAPEVRFSPPLSTAPDSLFAAVLFAASAMLIVRYTVVRQYRRRRSITWFTTGALLVKLADTLDALAVSDEHAPRRAAAVVRELNRVWNEKVTSEIAMEGPGVGWIAPPRADLEVPPLPASRPQAPPGKTSASVSTGGQLWAAGPPGTTEEFDAIPTAFKNWSLDRPGGVQQAQQPLAGAGYDNLLSPSCLPHDFGAAAATAAAAAAAANGPTELEGFAEDEFWASFMGSLGAHGSF